MSARTIAGACLATLALLAMPAAHAHAFALRGGVVSSGAQNSSGGGLRLLGTVGQPVVGGSANASFFLCHGFWCFGGTRVVSVEPDPRDPGATAALPKSLAFGPPSPNPARGFVRFSLALPKDAVVTFAVYDVAGRQLGEPVRQAFAAGYHELRWSAPEGNAGVYFGRLEVEGEPGATRRIVLVK